MAGNGVAIEIKGLKEFRSGLRKAGHGWPRVLAQVNRDVARFVERKSKGSGLTAQQAKAAGAVKGRGTQREAKITIGNSPPFAIGAFMGALQYAQFPEWVGNSWDVGGAGGPYAINPAIRESKDDIVNAYGDGLEHVARAAFPDGIPARKSPIFTGAGTF